MAQFTNQATLTYNGLTTSSNVAVGELQEVLTASKTAVYNQYGANDSITYVISLVNSGTTALTGLTIGDNLGAYTFNSLTLYPLTYVPDSVQYYVNGSLQTPPAVVQGPPLSVTGINVPAGGNATVIYEVLTNSYTPLEIGSTIVNTAQVSGGGLVSPVTASETVNVDDGASLSIIKSMNPTVVTENGQLTYTFVIQNTGNTAVATTGGAVITDTFDPILSNITVTFNGTPWVEGSQYSYNTSTGEFSTISGTLTVPAASYTQDLTTGVWNTTPGISTLIVTGTV